MQQKTRPYPPFPISSASLKSSVPRRRSRKGTSAAVVDGAEDEVAQLSATAPPDESHCFLFLSLAVPTRSRSEAPPDRSELLGLAAACREAVASELFPSTCYKIGKRQLDSLAP